jgi:hypothetical protein
MEPWNHKAIQPVNLYFSAYAAEPGALVLEPLEAACPCRFNSAALLRRGMSQHLYRNNQPDFLARAVYSVRLLSCSRFSGLAPWKEGAVGPTIEEFESISNTYDHPGW